MNLYNLNPKKLLLFGIGLLLFAGFVVIFFPNLIAKQEKGKKATNILEITPKKAPKEEESRFTGASLDLPEEIKNTASEKTSLLERLPYKQKGFSINFNYKEAKFIVSLSEPKEKNKEIFLNWLKNNYSNIPKDQFIFK